MGDTKFAAHLLKWRGLSDTCQERGANRGGLDNAVETVAIRITGLWIYSAYHFSVSISLSLSLAMP